MHSMSIYIYICVHIYIHTYWVPLKGYEKGTIRVPFKGSVRVQSFRKLWVPYLGVLVIGTLLFRVLY